MSQLIKPQIKWTPEKIQLLRDEYPLGDKAKLAESIGVSRDVLKYAAKRFKVKSILDQRGYRAYKLLDDSLESYYWHGFIMADGHISINNIISITLSYKDELQLINFRNFLNIDQPLKIKTVATAYSKTTTSVSIAISDVDTCEKFRDMYNVGNNKTTLPPNISLLLNEKNKFLSFFIGLFDGDGCFDIRGDSISCMKIECHANWYPTLELISKGLKYHYNIDATLKFTKRGYACFRIYKYQNFITLKNLILSHNLPAMCRKWDNVNIHKL